MQEVTKTTPNDATAEVSMESAELNQTLKKVIPQHPALNRMRAKLVETSGVEAVITSYDRMHHRHNRS